MVAGSTRGTAALRWERIAARDGAETLLVSNGEREQLVYSRRAPREQAARQVADLELWDCDLVVWIGLGLGHHLRALLERRGSTGAAAPRMIAVEPSRDWAAAWQRDSSLCELSEEALETVIVPDGSDWQGRLRDQLSRPGTGSIRAFVLPHVGEIDADFRARSLEVLEMIESVGAATESTGIDLAAGDAGAASPELRTAFEAWQSLGNPLRAYEVAKKAGDPNWQAEAAAAWTALFERFRANFEANRVPLGSHHLVGSRADAFRFTGDVERDLALCEDVAWTVAEAGVGLLVVRDGVWKKLDYGDPPAELGDLAKELMPIVWDDIASPHWLRWFREKRPEQFLTMRPTVYVVLRSRAMFRILLHAEVWADVLGASDYYWLIGPNAASAMRDLLVRRPMLLPPIKHFRVDLDRAPTDLPWESIAHWAAAERERRFHHDNRMAALHYERVEAEGWPKLRGGRTTPSRATAPASVAQHRGRGSTDPRARRADDSGSPLRILFITCRYTTVLQYTISDLSAAFEAIGCETQTIIELDDTERINNHEVARRIARFRPDLIVQIDSLRPHFPWVDSRIPYVGWLQDRLPRLFEPDVIAQLGMRDLALAMWPELAEQCRKAGYPEVGLLPVAVNAERYSSPTETIEPSEGAELDVAFVSNVKEPSIPGLLEAIAEYCREHGYGWGDPTHYAALLDWLEQTVHLKVPDGLRSDFQFQLYVEFERYLQRIEVVRWAIDAGLRIGLFGAGWEQSSEFAPYARGWVKPGAELRDLYRNALCHLQINLDTNVHTRVFECLASGGVVIARAHPTDRSPGGLAEHLEIGREVLTFADREEFVAVVERLRAQAAWRREVARRGHARVLREHTYQHRAREILRAVSARLETEFGHGLATRSDFALDPRARTVGSRFANGKVGS